MSERYEWTSAKDCAVTAEVRGVELGEDSVTGEFALVLGHPWASAFVIEGTKRELWKVLSEATAAIEAVS